MTDRPTYKGKIGRLPWDIREQLNARILNSEPGPRILRWLNAIPQVRAILADQFEGSAITPQNLSEWRKSGYEDWRSHHDQIELTRARAELAMRITQAAGGSTSNAAAAIMGGRVLEVLETMSDDDAMALMPGLAKLHKAEAEAMRARTDRQRLQLQERNLSLAEKKFQRETCRLFLKWYADKQAREIAEGKGSEDVKMDQLITLMWGTPPDKEAAAS